MVLTVIGLESTSAWGLKVETLLRPWTDRELVKQVWIGVLFVDQEVL